MLGETNCPPHFSTFVGGCTKFVQYGNSLLKTTRKSAYAVKAPEWPRGCSGEAGRVKSPVGLLAAVLGQIRGSLFG